MANTKQRFTAARLASVARALLKASPLCAIATVSPRGRAHVNTAYFAWDPRFEIVWVSAPEAQHSRNIERSSGVSVAIFNSHQRWGGHDRGIQMFGSAREARGAAKRDAERLYARRFEDHKAGSLPAYRFYRFRPRTVKLFHEQLLGGGTFVTAGVTASGALRWIRTEQYQSE